MVVLTAFGPWTSSILALRGRPSVFTMTFAFLTAGLSGKVMTAPPWTVLGSCISYILAGTVRRSVSAGSEFAPPTLAVTGNSTEPMLRMNSELESPGHSMMALKGRYFPLPLYTSIFSGVLSGPWHKSTLQFISRPSCVSVVNERSSAIMSTTSLSTSSPGKDQVLRAPPWTVIGDGCSQILRGRGSWPRFEGAALLKGAEAAGAAGCGTLDVDSHVPTSFESCPYEEYSTLGVKTLGPCTENPVVSHTQSANKLP
mmetsp:Transcript_21609/g.43674  ORF Transcript_21609/g.43674 Transcript_21609/m.43674 type:complete len:256 (+) Transcript_21609:430-1197(+)